MQRTESSSSLNHKWWFSADSDLVLHFRARAIVVAGKQQWVREMGSEWDPIKLLFGGFVLGGVASSSVLSIWSWKAEASSNSAGFKVYRSELKAVFNWFNHSPLAIGIRTVYSKDFRPVGNYLPSFNFSIYYWTIAPIQSQCLFSSTTTSQEENSDGSVDGFHDFINDYL